MTEPAYAEVKTNPRYERGWNRLQTGIEIFVALLVVVGLLGLFGSGPLSSARDGAADGGINVRYDRVLRRTVQTDVVVTFAHAAGDTLAVGLPSSFAREMDIVSTSPRSATMRVTPDGIAYVFDIKDTTAGEIILSMKPKHPGYFASRFRVLGKDMVVRQIVWP